jgi:hypothetical protein
LFEFSFSVEIFFFSVLKGEVIVVVKKVKFIIIHTIQSKVVVDLIRNMQF